MKKYKKVKITKSDRQININKNRVNALLKFKKQINQSEDFKKRQKT